MVNKELKLISKIHQSTKRNYLDRMINSKVKCMLEAKKYEKNYWDGHRKYGYGGYKYIPDRLRPVAKKLIKKFKLHNKSKILDVGCGKGYLLYEIKKILPKISIIGFDKSKYAIKNAHKEVRRKLFIQYAEKKYPFKNQEFDLAISLGCFHNLEINHLMFALKEIQRVSKKSYVMVESYRNEKELFNLQCWALTCESFFSKKEWKWIFNKFDYKNYYEFIYFS
jgi:ubiquinone/menaquinone biosynthesis C-methylase UbiE